MYNQYVSYLDDLNHKERSIFFYCAVLKFPQKETAKHLKLSQSYISKVCKKFDNEKNFMALRDEILEAFLN